MQQLSQSIRLQAPVVLEKKYFMNAEIYPKVSQTFKCLACQQSVEIIIQPLHTGFPLEALYKKNNIIDKATLLEEKIVSPANADRRHWGEILHNNLPTLYFLTACSHCKEGKYIGFFSYGERQPGLDVLSIAGVWKYTIV